MYIIYCILDISTISLLVVYINYGDNFLHQLMVTWVCLKNEGTTGQHPMVRITLFQLVDESFFPGKYSIFSQTQIQSNEQSIILA